MKQNVFNCRSTCEFFSVTVNFFKSVFALAILSFCFYGSVQAAGSTYVYAYAPCTDYSSAEGGAYIIGNGDPNEIYWADLWDIPYSRLYGWPGDWDGPYSSDWQFVQAFSWDWYPSDDITAFSAAGYYWSYNLATWEYITYPSQQTSYICYYYY